jgi:hypothetical protein
MPRAHTVGGLSLSASRVFTYKQKTETDQKLLHDLLFIASLMQSMTSEDHDSLQMSLYLNTKGYTDYGFNYQFHRLG